MSMNGTMPIFIVFLILLYKEVLLEDGFVEIVESHILHWTNESLLLRLFIYFIKILVGYSVKARYLKTEQDVYCESVIYFVFFNYERKIRRWG